MKNLPVLFYRWKEMWVRGAMASNKTDSFEVSGCTTGRGIGFDE